MPPGARLRYRSIARRIEGGTSEYTRQRELETDDRLCTSFCKETIQTRPEKLVVETLPTNLESHCASSRLFMLSGYDIRVARSLLMALGLHLRLLHQAMELRIDSCDLRSASPIGLADLHHGLWRCSVASSSSSKKVLAVVRYTIQAHSYTCKITQFVRERNPTKNHILQGAEVHRTASRRASAKRVYDVPAHGQYCHYSEAEASTTCSVS